MKKLPRSLFPILMIGAGILFFAVALVSLAIPSVADIVPTSSGNVNLPYPEVTRISVADAKAAFDIGNAIFLDVRSAESYVTQHISSAINIPLDELPNRIKELNPDAWIITYCT